MKISDTRILITGGAGFIGKALALKLSSLGAKVVIFDCLSEQVHGKNAQPPEIFDHSVKFVFGDVLEYADLKEVLKNAEVVVHLAAETGVAQSMYQVAHYSTINMIGTANILDILANSPNKVRKLLLASSRAIYGEGIYHCHQCGEVYPQGREKGDLQRGIWEPRCPSCQGKIFFKSIDEKCRPNPQSVYAISKYTQEKIIETLGNALGIPYTIVRLFNVYGNGQAMGNPYTGILSVFGARILNNKPLQLFEDGLMSRDFIYIEDSIESMRLCLEDDRSDCQIYNVGTGRSLTILDVAMVMLKMFDSHVGIKVTGDCRCGDVRHAVADISKISHELGFRPRFDFVDGLREYVKWIKEQKGVPDSSEKALEELNQKKMLTSLTI